MRDFKNLIRVGEVSSVNYEKGLIRVKFEDIVTQEIPMITNDYEMPDIDDLVLCLFLPNGIDKGFCLGKYWNDKNLPIKSGKDIIYKDLTDGYYIKFDKSTGSMELKVNGLKIIGDITVEGDVEITGDLSVNNITANEITAVAVHITSAP